MAQSFKAWDPIWGGADAFWASDFLTWKQLQASDMKLYPSHRWAGSAAAASALNLTSSLLHKHSSKIRWRTESCIISNVHLITSLRFRLVLGPGSQGRDLGQATRPTTHGQQELANTCATSMERMPQRQEHLRKFSMGQPAICS